MRCKINRKKLPINLLRQRNREQRHSVLKKSKPKKQQKIKIDKELKDHEAFVRYTELQLKKILESDEVLSDIPFDCTPQELQGEVNPFHSFHYCKSLVRFFPNILDSNSKRLWNNNLCRT